MKKFSFLLLIISFLIITIVISMANTDAHADKKADGKKICSVYLPGVWRDTVNVGDGWAADTCKSYMKAVGAKQFQIGCITNNSFVFGTKDGNVPSPNCGW